MYTYIYEITRYGELTSERTSNVKLEEKDIMSFYDQPISRIDYERIKNDEFMCFAKDYVEEYIIGNPAFKDYPLVARPKYRELMGDCLFYEGLEEIKSNVFEVQLGS